MKIENIAVCGKSCWLLSYHVLSGPRGTYCMAFDRRCMCICGVKCEGLWSPLLDVSLSSKGRVKITQQSDGGQFAAFVVAQRGCCR